MKSTFFKFAIFAGLLAPLAQAQSIYRLVGDYLPVLDNIPLRWVASVAAGYDTNVNATSDGQNRRVDGRKNEKGSSFSNLSLSTSFSTADARTSYSFSARASAYYYPDAGKFQSNNFISDCNFSFNVSHSVDPTLRVFAFMNAAFQAEPDYTSAISTARRTGEYFTFNTSCGLSKSWTNLISTTHSISSSAMNFTTRESRIDDRFYMSVSNNGSYRMSQRTSLTLGWTLTHTERDYGVDDLSHYLTVGAQHAYSARTNLNGNVGMQVKTTNNVGDGQTNLYPTLNATITHKLDQITSISWFVRVSNENTGTYASRSQSYLDDMAIRTGFTISQQLTERISGNLAANLMNSKYKRGTDGLQDRSTTTYQASAGVSTSIAKNTSLGLSYSYTYGKNSSSGATDASSYNRSVYSMNVTYSF